jgi:hypothetical protein
MLVRVPRFLAVPICVVGACVWVGEGIATLAAKPTVTVYAGDSDVDVEVLDAKQKVETRVKLYAGDRTTLTTTRGKHTIRSTKLDGTKHESTLKLGFADKYAVPTSPDQCFALINISAWYGERYEHKVDVIDAKIEKRLTKSEPYEFPDETYGTLRETPTKVDYKDHPKMVTAVPCSKIASASDGEILATLERRLTMSSTTLTSITLPKAERAPEKAGATSGAAAFSRMMGEQKPDWMRVHEDDTTLAYRNKSGEFLIVDARAIPSATADFVANIEKPETKGVYRKADILPTLAVAPSFAPMKVDVAGDSAGLVLRRTGDTADTKVTAQVLQELGTEIPALAVENAKKRYGTAAATCIAKSAAKPFVCTSDRTEATGILLAAADSAKVKGKVWLRLGPEGLEVRKASKKPPPPADLATSEWFTLQKTELTKGAK